MVGHSTSRTFITALAAATTLSTVLATPFPNKHDKDHSTSTSTANYDRGDGGSFTSGYEDGYEDVDDIARALPEQSADIARRSADGWRDVVVYTIAEEEWTDSSADDVVDVDMEVDMDVDSGVQGDDVELGVEGDDESNERCNERWAWLCRLHAAFEKTVDDIKFAFHNRTQNCHPEVTSVTNLPTHIVVRPDHLNTHSTVDFDSADADYTVIDYADDIYEIDLDDLDLAHPKNHENTHVSADDEDEPDFDPHARLHALLDASATPTFLMAILKPLLTGLLIGALAYGIGVTGGLVLVYVWAGITGRRRRGEGKGYGPVALGDEDVLKEGKFAGGCEKEVV